MRNQTSSHKKPTTIVTIIKTPIRVVSKALDLYVKGVNNFSTTYNKPFIVIDDTANCHRFPRSFSTSRLSDNDQPQAGALVRSMSATGQRNMAKLELEMYLTQHRRQQLRSYASRKGMRRGCSVRMGKIDEDRVSSFRENNYIVENKLSIKDKDSEFSRSRSYNRESISLHTSPEAVLNLLCCEASQEAIQLLLYL
ncbi:hypothetical protein L1987_65425 [Smallanthus sonchifolius]|uniref:Uncharacterized protein n=1 Tax=Smallanthus sonchifolius TaxID=185202 RepID=A0ACB9BUN0_9ASTR|nr:hypothetical protein L1987_65425 [Smallanthus sonchifolius]